MSQPDQLDRIRTAANAGAAALAEILAALDEGGQGPGELAPPTGFTATWDGVARRITCRCDSQDDAIEVHEDLTDPAKTLKATLAPGTTVYVSSELKGGHPYRYGLRSVRGGQVSDFSRWITIDVPLRGEEDEPDEEEPGSEEPTGRHPSDVLPAMRTWTLTRPTGTEGDPDNDYLVGETLEGLCFVREDGGVVFRCPAGGVTTENSDYPRDELREMADDDWTKAQWSSHEPHSLEWVGALDASDLEVRPRIVGAQIHGGDDDVLQLMLHETDGLGIMHKDGKAWESLDPDYQDGQRVTVRIDVVPRPDEDTDLIQVWYEGRLAAEIEARGDSWYWKAGVYVQSSPEKWGERPDAVGEVVIFRLVATGNPLA